MTAARAVYAQCGLRLRSSIPLHLPIAGGDEWDVDIAVGPDLVDGRDLPAGDVVAQLAVSADDWWYCATETSDGYVLRVRDRCDFVISSDVTHIEVRPAAHAVEFIPVLLTGTVLSFVLGLRGHTVLHASAVAFDGVAVAFVAPSGGGKSTTAALLCLDGAALVTDDVLVVDAGPPVTGIGGSTELRLREGAQPLAAARDDVSHRVTADERMALRVEASPIEPLPLAAIMIPSPSRTVATLEVETLTPSRAVFNLLAVPRIYGWRRPDILSRDFAVLSDIVNRIPVYAVTIPWGPPFSDSIASGLRSIARYGTSDGAG